MCIQGVWDICSLGRISSLCALMALLPYLCLVVKQLFHCLVCVCGEALADLMYNDILCTNSHHGDLCSICDCYFVAGRRFPYVALFFFRGSGYLKYIVGIRCVY